MSDLQKALDRASDHDPNRVHTEMWPAIEALAEEAGWHVPDPLVTKTFMVSVTARFPRDHDEAESEIAMDLIHSVPAGGDNFAERVEVRLQ